MVMTEIPLGSEEWHAAITGGTSVPQIVADIENGRNAWYQTILDATAPGESLLELGCGTGVFSGLLAKNGRRTTLLDYSEETIGFCREVYRQAGLEGTFVHADVLKPFPFADNALDCVWSSGLLEHFTDEQLAFIMKESARVSRRAVISLVPNAAAVFYRIGKWYQESRGLWTWGREDPKGTLKPVFAHAGLANVREFSIDAQSAIRFVYPIRSKLLKYTLLTTARLTPHPLWAALNQGYLLVTMGSKAQG
jgi:SAM-dependent methyltransferase